MRKIEITATFKQDFNREKAVQPPDFMQLVSDSVTVLAEDQEHMRGFKTHSLRGAWHEYSECQLKFNLLLLYRKLGPDRLQLVRIGTYASFECREGEFTNGIALFCAGGDTEEEFPHTSVTKKSGERRMEEIHKKPSLLFAVLTLVTVVSIIAGGMIFFSIKLHLLMLTCWVVCGGFAKVLGFSYGEIEKGAYSLIQRAMGAVIILMCVGALIGSWISAGTVPVMIYAGLQIITPKFFLVTSLVICSVTSLTTGTSWGTIGTVGLALMGIGAGLGFDPGITAASIICGAFFGDKMSPLSDTTNMAAAVSGVPLLRHVKHMFYTITPAYLITLVIYGVLGFSDTTTLADSSQLTVILTGISSHFKLGIIPALPMVLVLILLVRQTNPVLAILSGALFGVVVAVGYAGMEVTTAFNSMWGGYKGTFDNPLLAKLLNRGGITSMLDIAALVIAACGLGGMLKHMGVIDTILEPVARRATSGFSLVFSTLIIGYGTLMLTAACYFSIVMTGTIMAPLFRKQGYRPENCSRVVEDAGTLGGPLVPWSSNALFPMSMLSVSYLDYAPWAFLLYLTPLVSITYSLFNITMTRLTPQEMEEDRMADELSDIKSGQETPEGA